MFEPRNNVQEKKKKNPGAVTFKRHKIFLSQLQLNFFQLESENQSYNNT